MRIGIAATFAAAVIALTACSASSPSPVPIPAPSQTSTIPQALKPFYEQQLKWTDCGGAQCTKVEVPLDYANPIKASTQLNVVKVDAQGERLGSLFVNPGGPGGSGFDYAKSAAQSFSKDLTNNFDFIGVDPRGVATSSPIHCLTDAQVDEIASAVVDPKTPSDLAQVVAQAKLPALSCERYANPEFTFMSTENVAKDFDIVRAAVGDERFNYLGKSYGTSIGVKYAELFPQRVGRMVLDGVLPTDESLENVTKKQATGFEEAFADFAADCATQGDCPYSGTSAQVAQQLRGLFSDLDKTPVNSSDGRTISGAFVRSAVLSYLYFPETDYPKLRDALNQLVNSKDPEALVKLSDERNGRQPDGHYRYNAFDSYFAVTCLDRQFKQTVSEINALAQAFNTLAPTFGESLAWGLLPCAQWPAEGDGPKEVNFPSSIAPILIISRVYDPATPVKWAENLHKEIPNSGLAIWDSRGHTAYHQGSPCIDIAVDTYLLQGVLPSANLECSRN
ncbi:MAG: alpha/beta hydrolase [Candidatus Nanopelagicales bacterium]|nr:alpha/beta hydrolase [Candidatus Nanopelagicales bacterium]